jgi:hypothetical protein
MHLNSGELTRLIISNAYWNLFKPYFLGSKEIIKTKLEEIGSIRNSLAHFRPIRADDVDVIKQNCKHVLLKIEQFLNQILIQDNIIPTNTTDKWYKVLKTLGTDLCTFTFHQSADEQWVRIVITYTCPIIGQNYDTRTYKSYTTLTIRSSALLTKYPIIARNICYLAEALKYPRILKDNNVECKKNLSLVISKSMLSTHHEEFKKSLEDFLLSIDKETELIKQDNLARGEFVHSVPISASVKKDQDWRWHYQKLRTPVNADDPPEYWGGLQFYSWEDFVAATDEYPWMPESVAVEEFPF